MYLDHVNIVDLHYLNYGISSHALPIRYVWCVLIVKGHLTSNQK